MMGIQADRQNTMTQPGEKLSERELCPEELLAGQEAAFARDMERMLRRKDEFLTVVCPACSSSASRSAFEKCDFHFQSCTVCETIYMSPRPSPAVMTDYYTNSENYAYWAEHIFPVSEASRREKIHKPWLERVVGLCERYGVDKGTLLEVGPGFGTFAAVATESGAFSRVVAVEPTPEMANACRGRGVDVLEKRIEDVGNDLHQVDVVVCFEVIEHLFAPIDFVRLCAKLLVPGGLLVLTCPNGLGFDIATLGAQSLAVDAEHVNLFNPKSLGLLVEQAGLAVLESATPGRLDAEFVRDAVLDGKYELTGQPLLRRILLDEWEHLGWPFQQFLAENGLSSHMWLAAKRNA